MESGADKDVETELNSDHFGPVDVATGEGGVPAGLEFPGEPAVVHDKADTPRGGVDEDFGL